MRPRAKRPARARVDVTPLCVAAQRCRACALWWAGMEAGNIWCVAAGGCGVCYRCARGAAARQEGKIGEAVAVVTRMQRAGGQ